MKLGFAEVFSSFGDENLLRYECIWVMGASGRNDRRYFLWGNFVRYEKGVMRLFRSVISRYLDNYGIWGDGRLGLSR